MQSLHLRYTVYLSLPYMLLHGAASRFAGKPGIGTPLRKSKTRAQQQERREANLKNIVAEAQDLKIIEKILLKEEHQRTLYERLLLKQVQKLEEKQSTQPCVEDRAIKAVEENKQPEAGAR